MSDGSKSLGDDTDTTGLSIWTISWCILWKIRNSLQMAFEVALKDLIIEMADEPLMICVKIVTQKKV